MGVQEGKRRFGGIWDGGQDKCGRRGGKRLKETLGEGERAPGGGLAGRRASSPSHSISFP